MVGNKYYKKYIERLIEKMPTTITYQKEHRVDDGYGGHEVTIEEVEHKVAMYNKTGRQVLLGLPGEVPVGVGITKLLTKPDVEMKEGQLIYVGDEEYRVYLVKDYLGICKQIEIEVVKYDS